VVSQTCPPACSEVFNTACIVYTGVDLTCTDPVSGLTSTIISRNDYLDTALTALVNYLCARFNPATIPSSVVVSGDSFVVVDAVTVGYVTTYTVTLDPAGLPTASIVTGGANAVVTGDGSGGDPYVVNANESIVAVDAASALTLLVDPSTPGPYETTYTIGVDAALLPDTVLQTSFGHISITEIPNTPNAGDTTYTLEVDEVTVETSDDKLDVTLTSAGGVAPFERTFDVTVDDTIMAEFIMDTLNQAGPGLIGLQEGAGIGLLYDSVNHVMTISSTFTDPLKWLTLEDFAATSIDATTTTSTIVLSADASSGLTAVLGGDGNTATYTLENVDKGSDQLIFGTVAVLGQPDILAATNTDTLTFIEGANIGITTDAVAQSLTIINEIDHVYSDVIADSGGSLQAATTTSTLEILGGTGITTAGTAGPTNSISIENDANVYATIDGDAGTPTTATNLTDTLSIVGGTGCSTTISSDTVTVENTGVTSAVAGEGITLSGATGAVTITADVAKFIASSVAAPGAGNTIAVNHALAEEDVVVTVRETGAAGAGFYAGVDYSLIFTDGNNLVITDIGGGLGAGTLRISVMG
tara:strand:+ start:1520 stop:3274 length:1755 start_codon:yes stop_codon:yes gene_type:complete